MSDDFTIWPYMRAECDSCDWIGTLTFSYYGAVADGTEHRLYCHSDLADTAEELSHLSGSDISALTERLG